MTLTAVARDGGTATRLGWWLGQALRVAVAALLLGGLLGAALGAARSVPAPVLLDDLAAGRVAEVAFADEDDYTPPQVSRDDWKPVVRWKVVGAGWRTADLDGYGIGPLPGSDVEGTVTDSVSGARAEIRRQAAAAGVPVSASGPAAPRQLILAATVTGLLVVLVLIGGPQPRYATKWAWFWLLLVPGGVAALVWVAVEAPWSSRADRRPEPLPHREQPEDRRLTGGRALVLSLALGAVLSIVGTGLAGWLAG